MKHIITAIALCAPIMAQAATVSGIQAHWTDADGNASGLGTTTLQWGMPVTSAGASAFTLTSEADTEINSGEHFQIVTLTHDNRRIYFDNDKPDFFGGMFSFSGLLEGELFGGSVTVGHNETQNYNATCPSGIAPCADIVTLLDFSATGLNVGWCDGAANFVTPENKSSSAAICGRFEAPPQVPLPANVLLLLTGLAFLTLKSKSRKPRHER